MKKNKFYELGVTGAKSNIKYIEQTIFKTVQKAIEDTTKQLNTVNHTESSRKSTEGALAAYMDHYDDMPDKITEEEQEWYETKVKGINKLLVNGVMYSWKSPTKNNKWTGWMKDAL
jgi:hypothetical protein